MKEDKWSLGPVNEEEFPVDLAPNFRIGRRGLFAIAALAAAGLVWKGIESVHWTKTDSDGNTIIEGTDRGRILSVADLAKLPTLSNGDIDLLQFSGQTITLPLASLINDGVEKNVYLHGGFGQLITSDVQKYSITIDGHPNLYLTGIDQITHLLPPGNDVYHAFDQPKNSFLHKLITGKVIPVLDSHDKAVPEKVLFYLQGLAAANPTPRQIPPADPNI